MESKQIQFLGDSLDQIKSFPGDVKQDAGYQLDQVQRGRTPDDWKPFPSIGAGVNEIRIKESGKNNIYRVMYIAKFADRVYVLHAFQKKTQQTAKKDIDLAKKRLKEIKQ